MTDSSKPDIEQFYRLHYSPRPTVQSPHRVRRQFRAQSMINVNLDNPGDFSPPRIKGSLQHKLQSQVKHQPSSFLQLLAVETDRQEKSDQIGSLHSWNDIEELGKRNTTVRAALLRAREEKMKVSRLLKSHKQSQETKLDYLELKRNDLQHELVQDVRRLYDSHFRSQYEAHFGTLAYDQFENKIKGLLGLIYRHIYPS